MTRTARVLHALDLHDRQLLGRVAIDHDAPVITRWTWMAITQLGSAVVTIAAVLLPLIFVPWPRAVTARAAIALTVSHLVVQSLKRRINRGRPADTPLIACPDRFSCPSGHAAAALAVALGYGTAVPAMMLVLVLLAILVGWSRVVLGVHYPGDVVAGQFIAALTAAGVAMLG